MLLDQSALIGFIATTQPQQARVFYGDLLGLHFIEENAFALIFDAHGTMVRIQKVKTVDKATYTVLGWQVHDLDVIVKRLQQHGLVFEQYPDVPQDEQGIWTTPDGTKIVWLSDPDGNILSLVQFPHNEEGSI
jgi:extradiol dioxygenase family protein